MRFFSTRGNGFVENASLAIAKGLADDGGLFVPESFPHVDIEKLLDMEYYERSAFVLSKFLDEYPYDELTVATKKAYSKFEESDTTPVVKITDNLYILELFHGPTLAFKDVALTLLPYLLRKGCDISGIKEEVLILVATSGDTGKAALEGFKDNDGVRIMVLYPSDGVSDMQKLQMCTQDGKNVNVVAVKGNFDDCQNAVKKIFSSNAIKTKLLDKNVVLSSANSINFGRLAPQIVYYFSAYSDLVNSGDIKMGDEIDFVVPTGNFGDILAGYYAKQMGLPVGKLVCASNSNNVLTEFFLSGTYDKNREFFKTISPSMDILISSNLERLIFEVSGRDAVITKERMDELKQKGKYCVSKIEKEKLLKEFACGYTDEEECETQIYEFFDENGYVLDTHTSVAVNVAMKYISESKTKNNVVVLSTANPYKFPQSVLKAINGKTEKDAFKATEKLYTETACPIPKQITDLKSKTKRFDKTVNINEVESEVLLFAEKKI